MKCKKCGAELQEGNLYCEHCGEEIKIVPEFDLDFDNQVNQTIVSIAQDVFEDHSSDFVDSQSTVDISKNISVDLKSTDDDLLEDFRDLISKNKIKKLPFRRKNIIIFLSCIFVFFLLLILIISAVKHTGSNSYEALYREAVNSATNGNYNEAVTFMEKALAINPENADGQYLLAEYYYQAGNETNAIALLNELVSRNTSNIEDVYDTLISIYEENENYKEIADLLENCNDEVILSKYNKYSANMPELNMAEGNYERVISITFKSDTEGVIHYTLDNSNPNQYSMIYDDTPILLESGSYTVKAYFTNAYGIDSDITVKRFHITIEPPDAPQINIESGEYAVPKLIEVIYSPDTKVYYTTDGTIPDADSSRYTEPLEMPVGISNFHFVAINEAGVASEIEQRSFQVSMESYLAPELALQVLTNNLQVNGIILNPEGNVPERLGHNTYVVHTAVIINDNMYYIIVENYIDTTGSIHEAQSYYAIDAVTGDPYYAWKIGEGQYTLREF